MLSRFSQHFAAVEESLLASAKRLAPVSNTTIVGTASEIFIRDFLKDHLGGSIGLGTGEIISAFRPHDQKDRQQDVVVYDNRFPRLSLSADLSSFLIESVFCTIEVKTTLDEMEYLKSARAGAELKHRWSMQTAAIRQQPPRRFVVAFGGPAKMSTVMGWMSRAYASNVKQSPELPLSEMYFDGQGELSRSQHVSSSLDGIFVLGAGCVLMDSFRFRFNGAVDDVPTDKVGRSFHYACVDTSDGTLTCLFLALMDMLGQVELAADYMPALPGSLVTFHKMPSPGKI
jgi:hypothetical protein